MASDMDHQRCSELLGAYARGRLAADESQAVEAHLARCERCARELGAVRALVSQVAPAMTEGERARIRRAVEAEAGGRRAAADVLPVRHRPAWARFAPALAGAAVAALLVAGVSMLGGDGFGPADEAGEGAAQAEMPTPVFAADVAAAQAADSWDRGSPAAEVASVPRSQGDFTRLGRSAPFRAFARSFDTEDAQALSDSYVGLLRRAAPEEVRNQIDQCIRDVAAASPTEILPVYGAVARWGDRDVLVLGFVWTPEDRGSLERFMLWAWPLGNCDVPMSYETGPVTR